MRQLVIFAALLFPFRLFALEKVDLRIDGHILRAEVAMTPEEKSKGLMNRPSMPENEGMIFIFSPPEPVSFWMKNTLIPLTLAFVDEKLKLVEFHDLNPPVSVMQVDVPRASSEGPVLIVIEVNQGWFKKKKISLNARVELAEKTKNPLLAKLFSAPSGQRSRANPTH